MLRNAIMSNKSKRRRIANNGRKTKRRQGSSSILVIARQTTGRRRPLSRKQTTFRLRGGRTLVTSANKLTWGHVNQLGLFAEQNTRVYPNSYTSLWSSGSPYPASL